MYQVLIDNKVVLTTNDYDEAFDRVKSEAEWADTSVAGTRTVALRFLLN